MTLLHQLITVLSLTAIYNRLVIVSAKDSYEGFGTTYNLITPSDGNCNFMSWPKDAATKYAALNTHQWEGSMNCGRCAEVWCTDASCPGKHEVVYIMDQCPSCPPGGLDLSPQVFESITGQSDTRLSIEWKFVDCPIAQKVQYCLKTGSSEFWVAVQPTNCVSGVESLLIDGRETKMVDSAYYFMIDGKGTSIANLKSMKVSMKGINGEVLEETLSLVANECTEGASQFSSSGDVAQTLITAPNATPSQASTPPTTSETPPSPVSSPVTEPQGPTPSTVPSPGAPKSGIPPPPPPPTTSGEVTLPTLTVSTPSSPNPTPLIPIQANLSLSTPTSTSTSNQTPTPPSGPPASLISPVSTVADIDSTATNQTSQDNQVTQQSLDPQKETLVQSPPASEVSVKEKESESRGRHSTAAIVGIIAAVCVALVAVVGVAVSVHKKRKLLDSQKNVDMLEVPQDSYVSIVTPRAGIPVLSSPV